MLTGNRDTDFLILMQLNDNELGPVCATNKYIRSLCDDPNFWRNRILVKIKKSDEMAKKLGLRKNIPFDPTRLDNVKNYFGFENFQELAKYLSEFSERSLILLYNNPNAVDLDVFYKIDRNLLPDFVNYDKLVYFIARELSKNFFALRNDDIIIQVGIYIPGLKEKTHGIRMGDGDYKTLVKYGIRTNVQ